MSGGLNKQFKDSPEIFLGAHLLNTKPHSSMAGKSAGIVTINLIKEGTEGDQSVVCVTNKPSGHTGSHPIEAFWLPNKGGDAPSVALQGGADYFFTPAFTGCRLVIDPAGPTLTHIDGSYNEAKMNGICNVRSAGAFNTRRYWDNGEYYCTIVVGYRRSGTWKFIAQSWNFGSAPPVLVKQV